ncbi:MAG: O-antigen ligase family protein [Erysipelotrichaceae bacterium]
METIINRYLSFENNHKKLIIFLLFFPYVYSLNLPSGNIAFIDDLFEYLRVLCAIVIVFVFLFVKKKKPSRLALIIFIMELWQLGTTIFTNHKWVVAVYDLCACVAVPLLIEMYADDAKNLLEVMLLCFEIQLYPNLFTLLFKFRVDARGIGWYLLGAHNMVLTVFIPAAAVAVVYFKYAKNKIRPALLLVTAVISCFLCNCSTAEVAMAGAIGVFVIGYTLRNKFEIPLWLLFAVAVFGCFFVVFVFSDTNIPFLKEFIVNILHRDITFTERTYIWSNALIMIQGCPLYGYGFRTSVKRFENDMVGHAHNYLLDKTVVGGIPMLLLVFAMHFELIRGSNKHTNSIYKIALAGLLFGIFLTYITESYFRFYRFLIVFALMYNLDTILGNKIKEEN